MLVSSFCIIVPSVVVFLNYFDIPTLTQLILRVTEMSHVFYAFKGNTISFKSYFE